MTSRADQQSGGTLGTLTDVVEEVFARRVNVQRWRVRESLLELAFAIDLGPDVAKRSLCAELTTL